MFLPGRKPASSAVALAARPMCAGDRDGRAAANRCGTAPPPRPGDRRRRRGIRAGESGTGTAPGRAIRPGPAAASFNRNRS